ncbi:MAG: hypothetical protein PHI85_01025 [Victivallaceae bacterium]|nr:hypothetical protein [Victivallaceae bacterium]
METDSKRVTYQGNECFFDGNEALPFSLSDFWRWSASNLLDNTMRGMLAEYLVALAIDAQESTRREWSAWDLTTSSGIKIEVKSAAFLQNWHQKKPSTIRFGIQPARGWNAESGEYQSEIKRQADYYVFCLFTPLERNAANPLQLEQWEFYVLPVQVLDQQCKTQKTIGLSRLLALGAQKFAWTSLQRQFQNMHNSIIMEPDYHG